MMIGIDLGTTNSVVAIMDSKTPLVLKNAEGSRLTPSIVAYEMDSERRGAPALRRLGLNPRHSFTGVKRIIGRDFADEITQIVAQRALYDITAAPNGAARLVGPQREYSPIEISARILAKMKETAEEYLKEDVTAAVITVPAYFNDLQRKATREAGKMAGFKTMRIINEPTAAALAYGFRVEGKDRTIAVYDLGGGTFDISILKIGGGNFQVLATNGDAFLGGDDFDQRVVDFLVNGFQKQFGVDLRPMPDRLVRVVEGVETARKELSVAQTSQIYLPYIASDPTTPPPQRPLHLDYTLSREELEQLTGDLIDRTLAPCQRALADAGLAIEQIDEVVLVGGMTRMPAVRAAVEKFFGKRPVRGIDPDEAVAAGAAIFAGLISEDIDGVKLLDIATHGLGVELAGKKFLPIIPPGTPIPARITKRFSTAKDDQDAVTVRVMQGRSPNALENVPLGQCHIEGIERGPRGKPQVDVTFEINRDGEVKVEAIDVASGIGGKIKTLY